MQLTELTLLLIADDKDEYLPVQFLYIVKKFQKEKDQEKLLK